MRRRIGLAEVLGYAGQGLGAVYQPGDVSFGVLSPTSGQDEQRGRDLVDGAEFAIAELNVRGGVNGHKAALVIYDDGCDPKTARSRALEVKSSGVAGALGGVCASAARAAARTLGSELPFLVTSANAPSIVSARHTPTAFLTNGTPYQAALAAAHWLAYAHAQRISVVTEDDRAAKRSGEQLVKLASPVPKPLSQQAVPANTTDWGRYVKAALAGEARTSSTGPARPPAAGRSRLRCGMPGTTGSSSRRRSPQARSSCPPPGPPPTARS